MKALILPRTHRFSILALVVSLLLAGTVSPTFGAGPQKNGGKGTLITLDFDNATIESIARTLAVVTKRDIVIDPRVKGTMTLVTDHQVTPAAAFAQFAAALRMQSFAIVESDGLYKVIPEADAKLQGNMVNMAGASAGTGTDTARGNQVVTQIFRLNYQSANNLLPTLRPLISPNNTINVDAASNSLIITDYAENLRRIGRIMATLDIPNATDVDVIPLRYSLATDLAPLIVRLLEGGNTNAMGAQGEPSFKTTILGDPRSNSLIVRAANPARVQLVRSLAEKLDRLPLDTGRSEAGNIHVVYLKNADAVSLAATLRAAIAAESGTSVGAMPPSAPITTTTAITANNATQVNNGMSAQASAPVSNENTPSTGGQIQADPATNSLIITAAEPQYRQLRAVIERLDGRRAQVLVECLIAEVNANKAADFGIQWQTTAGANGDHHVGVLGTNSNLSGANIVDLAIAAATKNISGAMLGSGFNFGVGTKINGQYVLGFLAHFLQSNGEGNVLSTPNLLTLDNQEAKIVIGQNVPFVTGQYTNTGSATASVNPFQTVERKDVGLTLRMRPQINEDNTVKMTLFQEVSAIDPSSVNNINGPITNKRSLETSVVVNDGAIIVLGGLLQDEYSGNVEKVPVLGDIPVVGNLFKSEVRTRKKTNLMIFLRPVVIRDQSTSDALSYDRYEEIRSAQKVVSPDYNLMLNNVRDAGLLPALPPPVRNDLDNSKAPQPYSQPNAPSITEQP